MLIYTSGSTGTPKGVMNTFGAFSWASAAAADFARERSAPAPSGASSYLPLALASSARGSRRHARRRHDADVLRRHATSRSSRT
ncbi:MAG: AMP-binding protein [Rubrivivax sp.]